MNRLQVLLPPPGSEAWCGFETFAGLNAECKKRLFEICSFEYMGSSDYEMGISPKILYHIVNNRPAYALHKLDIKKITFYILIEEQRLMDYASNIESWSNTNYGYETHHLADIINKKDFVDKTKKPQGWLDIDEKAMFFLNEKMASEFDEFLRME